MNWLHTLANWLESRRVLRQSDLDHFLNRCAEKANLSDLADVLKRLDALEKEKSLPTSAANQLAAMKTRLDRIELLVGLKREPVAVAVPGASKIS